MLLKHVDALAGVGEYALLARIQAKGISIVASIFRLIEDEKVEALNKLLIRRSDPRTNDPLPKLDPNLRDDEGKTLLMRAVMRNRHRIVGLLLKFGANPLLANGVSLELFEAARTQSHATQRALYHPRCAVTGRSGNGWNEEITAEEMALAKYLKSASAHKQHAMYPALFMRAHRITMALLRSESFAPGRESCFATASRRSPSNTIQCWIPRNTLFPVPSDLVPSETTMFTLCFAITQDKIDQIAEDQKVQIEGGTYGCLLLENTYVANQSQLEYGFKYQYGDLATHGHGKNPNAAKMELKEHLAGIDLRHWTGLPDLRELRAQTTLFWKALETQFDNIATNRSALEALKNEVSAFCHRAETIIERRHIALPDSRTRGQEDEALTTHFNALREHVIESQDVIFTSNASHEWQQAIDHQLRILQELKQRLSDVRVIDSTTFQTQQKKVIKHLTGIKQMIVNRSVTAAEVAHFRVYESSLLIRDIFFPTPKEIQEMLSAMYKLIGNTLGLIPVQINERLGTHALNSEFRSRIVTQLLEEAEYLLSENKELDIEKIQQLASQLATFKNTHEMLTLQPPVVMLDDPMGNGDDLVLEGTVMTFLRSYHQAREILDGFWPIVSLNINQDISIIRGLKILSDRLLIMDEEISEQKEGHILYPAMDKSNPHRLLNESLFILQTGLFTAISKLPSYNGPSLAPLASSMGELIRRRFQRVDYGATKIAVQRPPFILSQTIDALKDIKNAVVDPYESQESAPLPSIFQILHSYDPPSRGEIEEEMVRVFEELSATHYLLKFSPKVRLLLQTVRQTASEIENLVHNDPIAQPEDLAELARLQASLSTLKKLMIEAKFASETQNVTSATLSEVFKSGQKVDPEKVEAIRKTLQSHEENKLKNAITSLHNQFKKIKSWKGLDGATSRDMQTEICGALESISLYLSTSRYTIDTAEEERIRTELPTILTELKEKDKDGTLVKSVSNISSLSEKLKEANIPLHQLVGAIISLNKALNDFSQGKKGRKYAGCCQGVRDVLHALIQPLMLPSISLSLEELIPQLDLFQRLLQHQYLPRLQKKLEKLTLAIRTQTYFTQDNQNVVGYLWAGEKFNECSYHSDDETHIPLVPDQDWEYTVRRGALDETRQSVDHTLHVTRVQAGPLGQRRRPGDPPRPLERSYYANMEDHVNAYNTL